MAAYISSFDSLQNFLLNDIYFFVFKFFVSQFAILYKNIFSSRPLTWDGNTNVKFYA